MSALGAGSAQAFLPIAVELSLASAAYIVLVTKPTPKHNLTVIIAYSSLKLLALSCIITMNMNIFSIGRIPFLLGLLLNEVVLLIASIRNRETLSCITIHSMYSKRLLSLRVTGEILAICVFMCVSVGSLVVPCKCISSEPWTFLDISFFTCKTTSVEEYLAEMLVPQLRGLSFAIAVTASAVSVSGWKFMLIGFATDIKGEPRKHDGLETTLRDADWKRIVRAVYAGLSIFTIALFALSFFAPGLRSCTCVLWDPNTTERTSISALSMSSVWSGAIRQIGTDRKCNDMKYVVGSLSNSLVSTILAISQLFVADVHVRMAAVDAAENREQEALEERELGSLDNESSTSPPLEQGNVQGPKVKMQHEADWFTRANSVLQSRASRRDIA